MIPFLIWDVIFTEKGVWGFNEDYLTGVYFFNLPIEEVMFFICIPYACVFTFFAFKYLFPNNPFNSLHKSITIFFVLITLLFIGMGWNQLYTLTTGVFTLGILLYSLWKEINLGYFYLTYLAIIPFFMASNGLLTGSLLDNPIVWYNNNENFGLRVLTIPIEDFIYALLLLALNIMLFERFSKKQDASIQIS